MRLSLRELLIRDQSFDPEAIRCLSAAFNGVCADLGLNAQTEHAREIIAKRVIAFAGPERNGEQLRAAVLASFRGAAAEAANARTDAPIAPRAASAAAGHEAGHDNAVLAGLPPSDLAVLAPLLHVVALDQRAGRQQDLSLEHVYFPHQGTISLLGMTSDGQTIEIASAGRDAALFPLLDTGLRDGIVVAQAAQSVSRVALDRLQAILRDSEPLRCALDACGENLLLQVHQNLMCNGLHSVERRLPRWLLEAADRMQTDIIPVTQEDVAQRLGVRRTTVTLVARKIQETGAMQWTRSRARIVDRALLASLACSCYTALRERMARLCPGETILGKKRFAT